MRRNNDDSVTGPISILFSVPDISSAISRMNVTNKRIDTVPDSCQQPVTEEMS